MQKKANTLTAERSKNTLLRTRVSNKILETRLTYLDKVKADFESLRPTPARTRARIETGNMEETALPIYKRLLSVNEARHLADNDLNIAALLDAIRTFSVGTEGGKVIFHTADPNWNEKAGKWFNSTYAKECDYRAFETLNDLLGQTLVSVIRDGDALLVCDLDLTEGKLLTFEADQLCAIDDTEWKNEAVKRGYSEIIDGETEPLKQVQGVITNRLGKVLFYVAHSGFGKQSVPWKEATVFPAASCRLVKENKRLNQVRGVSKLVAMIDTLHDLRQILKAEIQASKVLAEKALIVKQADPASALMALTGLSPDDLVNGTGETLPVTKPRLYADLEEAVSGVQYASKDDEFQQFENNRPSKGIKDFVEYSVSVAGKGLGLFACFATGKVDASYSAARAEILLTFATFSRWQKLLERRVMDFVVPVAIAKAVAEGALSLPTEPVQGSFSCEWPTPVSLDPEKEIVAAEKRLKAGLTTFSDELGANSDKKLVKLSEEKKRLEALGLTNLSFFQVIGGVQVALTGQPTKTDTGKAA